MINVEKQGRRHYIRGLPYDLRHAAKLAGCRWDPDEKCWWTGKADVAQQVAATAGEGSKREEGVPTSARVIRGRAKYNGKTCYLLADGVSQRTGKPYAKLAFRDGSKVFWAKDLEKLEVVKRYREPKSIDGLRAFAEKAKTNGSSHHGYAGFEAYCYGVCPVGRFRCCPENGPCHDCE